MKYKKKSFLIVGLNGFLLVFFMMLISILSKRVDHIDLSAGTSKDSFKVRPLTDIKYERNGQRLMRGKYLTSAVVQCFTCHSPRNWKTPGAPPFNQNGGGGDIIWEDSTMRLIAPNISSDKETGAGNWSDDMLARAIREGIGHDGRVLSPVMPYTTFKNLSDEDLASVIVFIRSLAPVHKTVLPTRMALEDKAWIQKMLLPITKPVIAPDFSDSTKRGGYLVHIAGCSGCHTSHAEPGPGELGGGNLIEHTGHKAFSVNITFDPSGITYGPEGFIFTIRTGKGETLSPIMPWIVFKNMTDADLRAIYAYLRSIAPVRHFINNQYPFTHCAICGQEHGLGEKNKIEKKSGIKN